MTCLLKALIHNVIIRKDAGIHHRQRDHAGASERRRIHKMRASQFGTSIRQTVGKDQPSLSVRVNDLNRLA